MGPGSLGAYPNQGSLFSYKSQSGLLLDWPLFDIILSEDRLYFQLGRAIINAKSAMASVKANPKIAYPNNWFAKACNRMHQWAKDIPNTDTAPLPIVANNLVV